MVHIVKQTRKQKIKTYMTLRKKKLAELIYNCNEVIDELIKGQKPYVVMSPSNEKRGKKQG